PLLDSAREPAGGVGAAQHPHRADPDPGDQQDHPLQRRDPGACRRLRPRRSQPAGPARGRQAPAGCAVPPRAARGPGRAERRCLALNAWPARAMRPDGTRSPFGSAARGGSVNAAEVAEFGRLRSEESGQVGDLLVAQALRLVGHQRVVAGAAAILLQGMAEVVLVLATKLGIGGVQRLVAVGAMAIDAGLARGLALDRGLQLAGVDPALGQAGRGGAAIGGLARRKRSRGRENTGKQQVLGVDHRAAHLFTLDRKAARLAMSSSEKLLACASIVGWRRVPRLYSLSALVRYSSDWPPILGTR